jgi:hypothetical protein
LQAPAFLPFWTTCRTMEQKMHFPLYVIESQMQKV